MPAKKTPSATATVEIIPARSQIPATEWWEVYCWEEDCWNYQGREHESPKDMDPDSYTLIVHIAVPAIPVQ